MVYKRGKVWWFKFIWRGEMIRESTKVSNKRIAEQIESARKVELAKGEVGFRDRKPVPTLATFIEADFLPFVRTSKKAKPNTIRFYENSATNLKGFSKLASLRLDQIKQEDVAAFVAYRQIKDLEISTINRDLATLRRIFNVAQDWGKLTTIPPRIRLVSGENHRERVLSPDEEKLYMDAATNLGVRASEAYKTALGGIRAIVRGEQPKQRDAFLLRDVVTVLIDCGLRPEECFRLKWLDSLRDGAIEIHIGKGRGSRRRIPASQRVLSMLEMRRSSNDSEWIFPAATKSGHVESSTLKKQHATALKLSGVTPFVLYTLRHTCITRWAKHMDPFTLHVLAGHTDMNTTKRYVHPSDADIREAMEKVQAGHKIGHTAEIKESEQIGEVEVIH
jgi:integrase